MSPLHMGHSSGLKGVCLAAVLSDFMSLFCLGRISLRAKAAVTRIPEKRNQITASLLLVLLLRPVARGPRQQPCRKGLGWTYIGWRMELGHRGLRLASRAITAACQARQGLDAGSMRGAAEPQVSGSVRAHARRSTHRAHRPTAVGADCGQAGGHLAFSGGWLLI